MGMIVGIGNHYQFWAGNLSGTTGNPIPMPQLAIAGSSINAIGSGVSVCL